MIADASAVERWAIALGWAAVVARPVARVHTRFDARVRARRLAPAPRAAGCVLVRRMLGTVGRDLGPAGRVVDAALEGRRRRRARAALAADLPLAVDLIGVGITAGATPFLATAAAAATTPDPLGAVLQRAVDGVAAGRRFSDELDRAAAEAPDLRPLVDALLGSVRFGAPVADALPRLAGELRAAARRAAEIHARKVPVRLLFPLVFLVLPAFGLLTVVPAVLSGFGR